MMEIFFGIITRQAIRRGSFTSVRDLITVIGTFIDGWNDRGQPFIWTKTADELLPHRHPGKRTSFSDTEDFCPFTFWPCAVYLRLDCGAGHGGIMAFVACPGAGVRSDDCDLPLSGSGHHVKAS
jgi:hypothetical protein